MTKQEFEVGYYKICCLACGFYPSRFQNFGDALEELTHKLYEGKYYNTANSSIRILYNLDFHRFQTFVSSSSFQYSDAYTRTDNENIKARFPSTITIVEMFTYRSRML